MLCLCWQPESCLTRVTGRTVPQESGLADWFSPADVDCKHVGEPSVWDLPAPASPDASRQQQWRQARSLSQGCLPFAAGRWQPPHHEPKRQTPPQHVLLELLLPLAAQTLAAPSADEQSPAGTAAALRPVKQEVHHVPGLAKQQTILESRQCFSHLQLTQSDVYQVLRKTWIQSTADTPLGPRSRRGGCARIGCAPQSAACPVSRHSCGPPACAQPL